MGENVASFELCRALFEVSGWIDTYLAYHLDERSGDWGKPIHSETFQRVLIDYVQGGTTYKKDKVLPAYDLGYLVRKLPSFYFVYQGKYGVMWYAGEVIGGPHTHIMQVDDDIEAETPENTACLLTIKLFKQGRLKGEG